MKKFLPKFGTALAPTILLSFMVFWFGPSEIFFSNVSQFEFKYGEFVWISVGMMLGVGIVLSLVTALVSLLSTKAFNIILALIMGIDVLSYVQVMFLNKGLDLLGQNPNGYEYSVLTGIINTVVWLAVLAAAVFLAIKKSELLTKAAVYLSVFLILIQAAGLVSLIVNADDVAYHRPENDWFLSGEEQMAVSPNDNVIVIVLDYFSNQYVAPMLAEYPDALDYLHDFTYYNNDDCTYFGTFPSMLHMLTTEHVDTSVTINEWTKNVLESESTNYIFDTIHGLDYKINIFTPTSDIYRGTNDIQILNGKFDNLANNATVVEVDSKLLIKTVSKMSAYRMAPEILKNCFYTGMSEYEKIVTNVNADRAHDNYDFYDRLLGEGLHMADSDENYFVMQHLMGDHDRLTGPDGHFKEESSLEENSKGCMVIVEEYLNQLKALGKYDDSTIIITSDHGSPEEPQVIFFMKKPGENHEALEISDAPICHCDLLPTVIEAMGGEATHFGTPVTMYSDTDARDRIF